jgi:hypothetical protein
VAVGWEVSESIRRPDPSVAHVTTEDATFEQTSDWSKIILSPEHRAECLRWLQANDAVVATIYRSLRDVPESERDLAAVLMLARYGYEMKERMCQMLRQQP